MGSTFKDVGFDQLYIKGVLWNLTDFKGEPGADTTSVTKGLPGDAGKDDGFLFNVMNTTTTTTVITLPNPSVVSYEGVIVTTNGVLSMATELVDALKPDGLKLIRIKTHLSETVAMLYANAVPQTVRFTKVFIPVSAENGAYGGYYSWNI